MKINTIIKKPNNNKLPLKVEESLAKKEKISKSSKEGIQIFLFL